MAEPLAKIDGQERLDMSSFCRDLRIAADAHPAFGLTAQGYCFDFAYRKVVIAEACRTKCQVDWATSMGELQKISADSGDLLGEVDTKVDAVALSHAVLDRTDWAIMLPCFAGMWSEVVTKRVDTKDWSLTGLLDLLRSGRLCSIVAEYKRAFGHAPHPSAFMDIHDHNKLNSNPIEKKRRADSLSATLTLEKSKKVRSMECSA